MQIHGDLVKAPSLISKLGFRVEASTTNFTGTRTFDMELFMGEGGSITNPSFTFNSNYTAVARTTVIPRTNVVLGPTGLAVTPGPNPFTMSLPLANPFPYSGARNLIWEAAVHGVTSVGNFSPLDADSSSTTIGVSSITGTGCIATGQATAMTHTLVQGDVGGTFHLSFNVQAGPASAPCVLALGLANPNIPIAGLCSNLFTNLVLILPYGSTSATGTITSDDNPLTFLSTPNTYGGATLFSQFHAIDPGRPNPILVSNSNGRSTVLPTSNLSHVIRVTRLWNNVGGVTATRAFFATSTVGYGLVTEISF